MSRILTATEIFEGEAASTPLWCSACKHSHDYRVLYSPELRVFYFRCLRCGSKFAVFKGEKVNKC